MAPHLSVTSKIRVSVQIPHHWGNIHFSLANGLQYRTLNNSMYTGILS